MLDTRDIIILTAAFYLGDVVSKFFTALNVDIVAPLLAPAAAAGKGATTFTVNVGGIQLKVGDFVAQLVNLVVSFFVVVFVIGMLRSYVLTRIGAARTA
uniref:Uncharacterized protein n=1 Tax=viral metagenome TaxID=1070528 RepID=A0A6C0J594_9ZZZZ